NDCINCFSLCAGLALVVLNTVKAVGTDDHTIVEQVILGTQTNADNVIDGLLTGQDPGGLVPALACIDERGPTLETMVRAIVSRVVLHIVDIAHARIVPNGVELLSDCLGLGHECRTVSDQTNPE